MNIPRPGQSHLAVWPRSVHLPVLADGIRGVWGRKAELSCGLKKGILSCFPGGDTKGAPKHLMDIEIGLAQNLTTYP